MVLPSPNGSRLSRMTGLTLTYVGCLRNAHAVAQTAMRHGNRIAVMPAGERWRDDDSIRFVLEDFIGAGAIINNLKGRLCPEAKTAAASFHATKDDLHQLLKTSGTGEELMAKGFPDDVLLASELNCDDVAPMLHGGAFVDTIDHSAEI